MVFFLMPMGIRKSHHSPHKHAISDDFIYCLKLVLDEGTGLYTLALIAYSGQSLVNSATVPNVLLLTVVVSLYFKTIYD